MSTITIPSFSSLLIFFFLGGNFGFISAYINDVPTSIRGRQRMGASPNSAYIISAG